MLKKQSFGIFLATLLVGVLLVGCGFASAATSTTIFCPFLYLRAKRTK